MSARRLPDVPGAVILRGVYYDPEDLRRAAEWGRARLAEPRTTSWERRYLALELDHMDRALETGRAD